MQEEYSPQTLETSIQDYWQKRETFHVQEKPDQEKFYCLSMMPYPSGELHMGHVRNYALADVIARYQRMQGKNVLQPISWDAFGLPAENAAIKHKENPSDWTYRNIAQMSEQLKRLGFGYDWSREIITCKPEYYRWEQWLFTRMYEKGLAYKKKSLVNWDPVDQTVLANEQVINGRGWRSGALVEQREIEQWFLRITAYASELLQDLNHLQGKWPDQVIIMQRNWIGQSEGVVVHFPVLGQTESITVFTTRVDTLFGVTFVAIAPQHPLAMLAAKHNPALAEFIETCRHTRIAESDLATLPKKGFPSGFQVIHPISQEQIPVWVVNYVLADYGSGAVMAVPAHDERDFAFAKQYHLPIKPVIQPSDGTVWDYIQAAWVEEGELFHSGEFSGLTSSAAKVAIAEWLEQHQAGRRETHYRLRDWGVSRQRYWGTPIPIIYCQYCGTVPVPTDQLPVILPEQVNFEGTRSPLTRMPEFYVAPCPKCGQKARRETDTFDTFVESAWYYARLACPDLQEAMLDERANYWVPVDCYIGGIEHAVMHLLYARFIHKVLRDEGLLKSDEPFARLLTQGMVLKEGAKMSKSKGNVVSPGQLIAQYGADTVRVFIIFAAPPEQSLEWSDSGVEGASRFVKRVWQLAYRWHEVVQKHNVKKPIPLRSAELPPELAKYYRDIHAIVNQVNYDYERLQLNTVVSGCMKLLNVLCDLESFKQLPEAEAMVYEGFSILLRLLAPIACHITDYLWQTLGYGETILQASWPQANREALQLVDLEIVIQINGKLRSKVRAPSGASEKTLEQAALQDPKVRELVAGKTIRKVIVVPNKLVNVVVS